MSDDSKAFLQALADKDLSRTAAAREAGMSWHSFRGLCADYPEVVFKEKRKDGEGRDPRKKKKVKPT